MEAEPDGHGANSRAQGALFASLPLTMPPAMKTEGVGGPDPCLFCAQLQSGAKRPPFDEKSSASFTCTKLGATGTKRTCCSRQSRRCQNARASHCGCAIGSREGKVNLATVAGVSGYRRITLSNQSTKVFFCNGRISKGPQKKAHRRPTKKAHKKAHRKGPQKGTQSAQGR